MALDYPPPSLCSPKSHLPVFSLLLLLGDPPPANPHTLNRRAELAERDGQRFSAGRLKLLCGHRGLHPPYELRAASCLVAAQFMSIYAGSTGVRRAALPTFSLSFPDRLRSRSRLGAQGAGFSEVGPWLSISATRSVCCPRIPVFFPRKTGRRLSTNGQSPRGIRDLDNFSKSNNREKTGRRLFGNRGASRFFAGSQG